MAKLAAMFLLVMSVPLNAQNLSNFARVLIPIYAPQRIDGAGGGFEAPLESYSRVPCSFWPAPGRPAPGRTTTGTLQGYETVFIGGASNSKPQSRFLFVDAGCADDVRFGLTVSSVAASARQDFRSGVPVVTDPEFFQGEAWLFNIPQEFSGDKVFSPPTPRYRHKLRVINAADDNQGEVDVTLWVDTPGPGALFRKDYKVALNQRDGADASFPYYGEVQLADVCLGISSYACLQVSGVVQIVPVTSGLRYWPLLSSTDNTTQQVFIRVPH